MAAQPLSLVDYGGTEVREEQGPARRHSRQPSWEQFSVADIQARSKKRHSMVSMDPQSVTDVMAQPQVTTPFTRNWSVVLAGIDALAAGIEDEVRPTDYAYTTARATIESVYRQIKPAGNIPQVIPEHSVTTDDVGGVRLVWRLGTKQVRANFGATANLQTYIYYESPIEHQVENLNAQQLAGRLAWLTGK